MDAVLPVTDSSHGNLHRLGKPLNFHYVLLFQLSQFSSVFSFSSKPFCFGDFANLVANKVWHAFVERQFQEIQQKLVDYQSYSLSDGVSLKLSEYFDHVYPQLLEFTQMFFLCLTQLSRFKICSLISLAVEIQKKTLFLDFEHESLDYLLQADSSFLFRWRKYASSHEAV